MDCVSLESVGVGVLDASRLLNDHVGAWTVGGLDFELSVLAILVVWYERQYHSPLTHGRGEYARSLRYERTVRHVLRMRGESLERIPIGYLVYSCAKFLREPAHFALLGSYRSCERGSVRLVLYIVVLFVLTT